MKPLSLSIVNGTCCVRIAVPGWMEPKWIGNHFPTTESSREVAYFLDIDESKLPECEVTERYPGYYVTNHPTCPRTAPMGVALSLACGAKTLSVQADIEDYPPPRTTCEVRYEDGKWWKNMMKRGWIRA